MNQRARTSRRIFGGILGLIAAALVAAGGYVSGGIVVLLAVGIVVGGEWEDRQLAQKVAQQAQDDRKVEEIVRTDFAALDVISPDVRWLGAEAQLVCFKYPYRAVSGFTQHVLGRSNKGAWFVVEYNMDYFKITNRRVYASDEATAKSWLAYDRDTYVKFFGMPATA